ncbi:MAG: hypothetical protein ACTSQ8_06635 [Candidatus Helarchaeota archaeon]
MVSQKVKMIFAVVLIIPILLITIFIVFINNPGSSAGPAYVIDGPTIFNHNNTNISQIPAEWIETVKGQVNLHYAHTSHGEQLTIGLERLENTNATFSVNTTFFILPTEAGALCIADGQKDYRDSEDIDYVTPDYYWEGEAGLNRTRDMLDNQAFNFSMWCWCTQLNDYDEIATQTYLDAIATLETEYPNVTFIYMTGNAQATGWNGYNRYLQNQYIREYCKNNSKYLFDFADIDCWYNGEQWTYIYENRTIPTEHPHYSNPSGPGHTTSESCELKARVLWWMFAQILGWPSPI